MELHQIILDRLEHLGVSLEVREQKFQSSTAAVFLGLVPKAPRLMGAPPASSPIQGVGFFGEDRRPAGSGAPLVPSGLAETMEVP